MPPISDFVQKFEPEFRE